MQQEAADEVRAGDRHRLLAVSVGTITPGEGDVAVFDGEDAVVGDSHAVSVASEIVEKWKYASTVLAANPRSRI